MLSPARVTSTVQVIPPRDAESDVFVNEQYVPVADHDREPFDCPPVAVRASVVPVVKDSSFVIVSPVWLPLVMVIVAVDELIGL